MSLGSILLAIAFVLAVLAAIGWPPTRVSLGWLSLAFYFASLLFPAAGSWPWK